MDNFEIVIFIMTVLIGLSAVADKIRLPYPILLVAVGLFIGFVPVLPNLTADPEIIFLIFLPPLLYDAAYKTSWHDFRKEIRTISTLAVSLVFFTTVIVAVAAHYLVPGLTWPLAFVLGAIISPPDAVAASGIIKGLGLNRRVITILEGESLLNDASALIAYRYAVGAVLTGTFVFWKASAEFVVVAAGGVLAGLVVGYVLVFAHKKITDNPIVETSLSLLTPFVAYLLAEHFHASGVLAVVIAGLYISWRAREVFSSQTRLQTTVVWDTLIFLLNGVVFILIGLQLPAFVENLRSTTVFRLAGYGVVISLVTIVIRILWVFAGAYNRSLFSRKHKGQPAEEDMTPASWKNVLIVAWTGTRGVVSLATALALPLTLPNGSDFPKRASILLLAFIVILITLVVQGLTLPLLIRLLKIKPEADLQKKEERDLQLTIAKSVLKFIDHDLYGNLDEKIKEQLRRRYTTTLSMLSGNEARSYEEKRESASQVSFRNLMLATQLEIVKFQREQLIRFHKEGAFNDETITKAERELDIEELRLTTMINKSEEQ